MKGVKFNAHKRENKFCKNHAQLKKNYKYSNSKHL